MRSSLAACAALATLGLAISSNAFALEAPTIADIIPLTVGKGEKITIVGWNFSATPTDNVVI
ncbi:MAG TPA: hypothetical protein VHK24_03935, partial [Steroidobacter sp.]|nr:hypothetical protein [Steroidobacter sp.]